MCVCKFSTSATIFFQLFFILPFFLNCSQYLLLQSIRTEVKLHLSINTTHFNFYFIYHLFGWFISSFIFLFGYLFCFHFRANYSPSRQLKYAFCLHINECKLSENFDLWMKQKENRKKSVYEFTRIQTLDEWNGQFR